MNASVLLVDDNEIFQESVRTYIGIYPEIIVAGAANNGNDALALAANLHPDVVLLDWLMPGLSGLGVLCRLIDSYPDIKVIILSMHTDEAYVESAVRHGAMGYIIKEDIASHLVRAIRAVCEGEKYFSPSLQKWLTDRDSQEEYLNHLIP
jgi:DNA-binding NarL/FixJ family response regulator